MSRLHSCCLAAAIAALSCGEGTTGPVTGSIEVTSITVGDPTDPDGYALTVDGETRPIATNTSVTVSDLAPGDHQLELGGIAPQCALAGPNPRTVAVAGGLPTQVTLQVECGPPAGSIQVITGTTGESPDPDGYTVALDGGAGQPIGANGSLAFSSVSRGEHSVRLTGLAPDCAVEGENPRGATVEDGPVEVVFQVTCGPPVGTIVVSATTAGPKPDPDGYSVSVDGEPDLALAINGSITISGLPEGDHQVQLADVASNCVLEGANPRTVSVTNGGTTPVGFQVSCHATGAGVLLFTSDRSGTPRVYRVEPDGSRIVNLTPAADGFDGDWSPDRSRIVFATSRDGNEAVYVMDADGSNPSRLAQGGAPSWSPDGLQIAFVGSGGISVIGVDGSNLRILASSGSAPAWSPDGSQIAFQRIDQTRCVVLGFDPICPVQIYVMPAAGGPIRNVTSANDPSDISSQPSWSPDGTKIAYARHCCLIGPELSGIWIIGSTGGSPVRIDSHASASAPIWSPDGSAIALASAPGTGPAELTVIPSEGGGGVVLASSPGSEYPTSWK